MADYQILRSDGTVYTTVKEQEVIGPVGYPTPSDTYFSSPLQVLLATPATKQFQISGDKTARFINGFSFKVISSASNNGTYTTASSSYNSTSKITTVTVTQNIPASTDPKGFISYQVPLTGTGSVTRIPLTLIGKGTTEYGDSVAENFYHLLENFASTSAPPYSIVGQTWYDKNANSLKVYNGSGYVDVGGSGGGGGGGASSTERYITWSSNVALTNERVLAVNTSQLTLTIGGADDTNALIAIKAGGVGANELAPNAITQTSIAGGYVDLTTTQNNIQGAKTFKNNMTVQADLTVTGTIYETSDIAYKENVVEIVNPLDIISKLSGVFFNKKDNSVKELGVIANEIEKVLPEVVSTNADGHKQVAYARIVGLLIEGIKELNNKIN